MSKFKVSLSNFLKKCVVKRPVSRNKSYFYIFSLFNAIRQQKPQFENEAEKFSRYWVRKTIPDIISEADKLYDDDRCMEVYELLNRLRFMQEVDILWRLARVLYKMSNKVEVPADVRWEMTEEAYMLLKMALATGQLTTVFT